MHSWLTLRGWFGFITYWCVGDRLFSGSWSANKHKLKSLVNKYLRVWVHRFVWWPIIDSLSLPPSFPLPFSLSFSLPLPLSVTVPALFPLPVSVPGPLAVFPSAAVVRGRLGAPLQWQVFLSVTRNLNKYRDMIINHPKYLRTVNVFSLRGKASSHISLRPWWGSSCILLAAPDKT